MCKPTSEHRHIKLLTELKGEIDWSRITEGDFNTTFSITDRTIRQEISKELGDLNNTISQLVTTEIYKTFHTTTVEYTSFSKRHGTLSSIDQMLAHKTSLKKFRKMGIMQSIFSDQNEMKPEIKIRRKTGKSTNTWKLNTTTLNNKWAKE